MLKLDVKDRKLIYHLSRDSRMSDTQLAKKVGLSKNSIKYRIERLKKEKIIKNFETLVDIGAIKHSTFTIILKFRDDIYENKEIINYLNNHPFSNWVAILSGQWDAVIELISKDYYHMHKLVYEILNHYGNNIITYKILWSWDTLRVEHLVEDFYNDLNVESLPNKKRTIKNYNLDNTDRKILNELCKDSSTNYLEIANRRNLTLDIVRYRIKKMVENEVIIKFFSNIDLKKLGYTGYLILIKLRNIDTEKIKELKNRIRVNSNVTYAFFDILNLSLFVNCDFKDPEGIDILSRSLRKKFADIIEDQEYLIIKEHTHFNLFPNGLVNPE